jgi:V/A-type H+/Na+-transporting ATPase subunit C
MNAIYLNTRISLLSARLWSQPRLCALIESDDSHNDMQLLQRRASLGNLDEYLWHELLADAQVLIRPLSGAARQFFFDWLRKADISNLKTLLRGKLSFQSESTLRTHLIDLHSFATLPIAALLGAEDPAEMLRLLERTPPYAEAARQARLVYEKKHELFSLEATLDYVYLSTILKHARQVEQKERAPLLHLLGYVLERYNFIWMLRYRFNYGLSAAETHYLLVPGVHSDLLATPLNYLLECASMEEVIARLPPAVHAWLGESGQNLFTLEQRVEERVRTEARLVLTHSSHALARALAYLLLRECEIRRISAIFKGRHIGLSSAQIRSGTDLEADMSPLASLEKNL